MANKEEKKINNYFTEIEENAIVKYNKTNSIDEKNRLFRNIIEPAFKTMIEAIIRRYNLRVANETFDETFNDAMTFMISKLDRYKKDNGRAYSYMQAVCKNHLIAKRIELNKVMLRDVSYEDISTEMDEDEKYSYILSEYDNSTEELLSITANGLDDFMKLDKISKNEKLVANALSELLKNWQDIIDSGSNKLKKSSILYYLKETTNLDNKDIRNSMRNIKKLYFDIKNDYYK